MLKWLLENLKTGGNEPDGEPDYPLCGDTDGKAMWQEQYKGIDDWELREPEDSYGNMALGTTAKDGKDGDQEAFAEKETQIIDTVAYKGLIAGESYWLVGTLMDKETEKEILINGKPVTAETTFKPEKPEGTVDVIFTFDAEALKGHDVVVFERLYVTVKEEDKEKEVELTNHEDIQAESQTVKLTEVPTEPEKPADTPDAPKTGDTTNLWIPIAVLVAALAGIVAVIIRIRSSRRAFVSGMGGLP